MAKEKKDKKAKKKKSSLGLLLVFTPLGIVFMGYTMVLFCGLIPSFIALLTDRERQKLTGLTVGALNLAATMPVLVNLWQQGGTREAASALLSSPLNWILMFAGAGIGWVLALVVPSVITGVIVMREKSRLATMRARQQELAAEWGPEVGETTPK